MSAQYMRRIFICSMLFALSACSPSPSDVIKKFETSFNVSDYDTLLDCFDPTLTKGVRASMRLLGAPLGIDLNDVLLITPLLSKLLLASGTQREASQTTLSIQILDEKITNDTARISSKIYVLRGNSYVVKSAIFFMKRENGAWFIRSIESIENERGG